MNYFCRTHLTIVRHCDKSSHSEGFGKQCIGHSDSWQTGCQVLQHTVLCVLIHVGTTWNAPLMGRKREMGFKQCWVLYISVMYRSILEENIFEIWLWKVQININEQKGLVVFRNCTYLLVSLELIWTKIDQASCALILLLLHSHWI